MKNKIVSIPIHKVNFEENNNQFDLAKVGFCLLSEGAVSSHGLYMELDSLNSIKDSINLKPILCAYETDENGEKTDFMGHEIEYKIVKKGKTTTIKSVYIEQPVGVLEDSNFQVQIIDNLNWVTCDGFLYNEYCEDAVRILNDSDGEKSVSIEFKILDGYEDKNDKLYHVTKIHFLGVTLLGESHNPAIQGANITSFTEKHNELFIQQLEKIVDSVNRFKNNKGGVDLGKDELIAEYKHLEKNEDFKKIIADENLSLEDMKSQLFALSNAQISRALREELSLNKLTKTNRWNETWEIQKYYLEDILHEENIAVCEDNENYYCYYGVPYIMKGDKAILEYDKAERYIKGDWRKYEGDISSIEVNPTVVQGFERVNSELDNKIEENEKLSKELNDTKADFTDAKTKISEMEIELDRLKAFENEILEKEKQAKVDDVLSQFEELKTVEGFEDLVSEKSKGDLVEFEKSLKVFAFDNGVILKKNKKKTFSKETNFIKTNESKVNEELTEAEKRYGASIKKYMSNY